MASIVAFAGSNSSTSINFKLVTYTQKLLSGHDVKLIDLAKHPLPMYSEDHEKDKGFDPWLNDFKNELASSTGIIISVNEHNGQPSAYFKNLVDWLSRMDRAFLKEKKVLLMATSPGKRGGASALEATKILFPRFGAEIVATFSLPSFLENMDIEKGITDVDLNIAHRSAVTQFLGVL